jgi:transcriptional regulator with XRE-family HTH domain
VTCEDILHYVDCQAENLMPRNRSNNPFIPLDFGDALKAARKAQKLTTTELAHRIDKTDPSISRYESGQGLPPKTTLEAIERAVKRSLRKEWERVRPFWQAYLKKRKEEQKKGLASDSKAAPQVLLKSPDETELIINYRTLNAEGRSRVSAFVSQLSSGVTPLKQWPAGTTYQSAEILATDEDVDEGGQRKG